MEPTNDASAVALDGRGLADAGMSRRGAEDTVTPADEPADVPPTPWQDPSDLDYRKFVELHHPAGDDSQVVSR